MQRGRQIFANMTMRLPSTARSPGMNDGEVVTGPDDICALLEEAWRERVAQRLKQGKTALNWKHMPPEKWTFHPVRTMSCATDLT